MNAKLEQLLAQQRALIEAEKERQQQESAAEEQAKWQKIMDELELYDEEKEYTDKFFANLRMAASMGYMGETVDGKMVFYKMKRVYPELSEEEKAAISALLDEKKQLGMLKDESAPQAVRAAEPEKPEPIVVSSEEPVEYSVTTQPFGVTSFGGTLMKILAVVVWAGGLIASIVLARVPDRWGDMQFQFGMFLLYVLIFFIAGASYFAIGELFSDVADINAGIQSLNMATLKPNKKK